MMDDIVQPVTYIILLLLLAWPLGIYMAKVMDGEKVFLSRLFIPFENLLYKWIGIDKNEEMNWKQYAKAIIYVSIAGFLVLFIILLAQPFLPLNPEHFKSVSFALAFNMTASFVTNTNWQSYAGETTLSYFSQMAGLTVQNFLSPAAGIAVLFALIRGFTRKQSSSIGNFWVDMTRSLLYIFIPLSLIVAIALNSQGVIQNFKEYQIVTLLQPNALSGTQIIPMGPVASQTAIQQLGTNGGGFFNVNDANPLANPTPFSNLIESLSILLIPAALCFSFGYMIKDKRQGRAILIAMLSIFIVGLGLTIVFEQIGTPELQSVLGSSGNMEGKEVRFGIADSAIWAVATTAASNGSVNAMLDSFTPLGGMIPLVLMQLGEVVFGGVGSGLYGMLAFIIITVFIAGLMVGRTPEYIGKKIEPFEMKMAALTILVPPVIVLAGTAVTSVLPGINKLLTNKGPHGFSEILYAFSSAGNNNGSAFAGFSANTTFLNVILGIVMIISRFVPMLAMIAVAGSLAKKKLVPKSPGTLVTHNGLFIGFLITVIILVGALSFLPALALGPIIEQLRTH